MKRFLAELALFLFLSTVSGFVYTFFTQQGFFAETKQAPQQGNTISLAEAKEYFFSGTAIFIDARHEYEFDQGHIKNALNIPLYIYDRYQALLTEIPKDKLIVVYCNGIHCNSSYELAEKLSHLGFTNIKVFYGGWDEWKTAGLPIQR